MQFSVIRRLSGVAVIFMVLSGGCAAVLEPPKPGVEVSDLGLAVESEESSSRIRVKTLAHGLKEPWAMDFLPDGRLLVTEKSGTLKLIDLISGEMADVAGVPAVVNVGQGGLMDVKVHPQFTENQQLYITYTVERDGAYSTQLSSVRLQRGRLQDHQVLFTAEPFFSQRRHFGSRVLLDEGYLYLTVGDRGNRDLAQSLASHNGKVLRLHADGRVPTDNPFVNVDGAKPEIWTYGHRNPQGLRKHPFTGELWISEHGPQGGDEVNALRRGANYGWPVITYGEEYGGGKIGEGTLKSGMEQPLTYYTPSIGTAGMDFYSGRIYPGWEPSLLVAGLRQSQIARLELTDSGVGVRTRLMANLSMRVRSVVVGPDGLIYALADGSRLIRLQPEP
ncbi:MAG: PQQ-dependent sugar dehydrogenase [Halioglobus sp.]